MTDTFRITKRMPRFHGTKVVNDDATAATTRRNLIFHQLLTFHVHRNDSIFNIQRDVAK